MQGGSNAIQIKLVIVGDGSVGKTCILVSYTTDKFPSTYVPTVFENYSAQIKVDDKMINLGLWYQKLFKWRDTAGQEEYNKLRQISYPQSDVFLITFAVNEPSSFNNAVKKWYPELQEQLPLVPKIFVGNKIDLRKSDDDNNFVQYGIAQRVISEMGCKYIECSALSQLNLKSVFDEAIRIVLKRRNSSKTQTKTPTDSKPIQPRRVDNSENDKSGKNCNIM